MPVDVSALAPALSAEQPGSLDAVIDNLRNVIVGLLVALATLFLTVGGVRYILAGGDPGEVEAAKKTLRYAALGYGIAVLAPLLVTILKGIVGAQ
jgi:phosphate uptake regulator